jgi:anthranilate phosphoribosyltransferase
VQSFIKTVGAGKRRARDLSRAEAREAMLALLATRDDAQVGAFLLAMRMKGETATELAGFVDALATVDGGTAQQSSDHDHGLHRRSAGLVVDVDAHGDGRAGRPSLLPAAAVVAGRLGVDVLVRVDAAGFRRAHSVPEVLAALLPAPGVQMLDLGEAYPQLKRLLDLRPRVGVRTFVNSLVKLWSPRPDAARLVGIFHGPYHATMAGALGLLRLRGLVVQAPGGLPEPPPDKPCKMTAADSPEQTFSFDPRSIGDPRHAGSLPECVDTRAVLELNRAALAGEPGPARKALLLAVAALLHATGAVSHIESGLARAEQALEATQ